MKKKAKNKNRLTRKSKDELLKALYIIGSSACDFTGKSGDDYLWDSAKTAGFTTNRDYAISEASNFYTVDGIINRYTEFLERSIDYDITIKRLPIPNTQIEVITAVWGESDDIVINQAVYTYEEEVLKYSHINDCWSAIREAKTKEEIENLFEEFPRWSGDWYIEPGSYGLYVVYNTYFDRHTDTEETDSETTDIEID